MTGYVVGTGGVLLKTTSRGSGWIPQATGTSRSLRSVHFPKRDTDFAVGDSGTILKASTGGRMIVDFNEQAICYEAAFRAFWGTKAHPQPRPWFCGFYWWFWMTDPEPLALEHELQIDFYTPQQKPAGEVLRSWYSGSPE